MDDDVFLIGRGVVGDVVGVTVVSTSGLAKAGAMVGDFCSVNNVGEAVIELLLGLAVRKALPIVLLGKGVGILVGVGDGAAVVEDGSVVGKLYADLQVSSRAFVTPLYHHKHGGDGEQYSKTFTYKTQNTK